ncbi:reverse transcriptase domain-containing protein [Tanacetum coccineum]
MEAQYGKFLDIIRAIRINVPLIDVLAGMPNYGMFLKELISNKHKIEQIYVAFLSDESSAMIQNKVPPKLKDPRSFLIPSNFNKTFSCNALADLGASINLMSYSLYAKLSLETLKPTKMSIRLADRSFQYPVGIAKNMLVEVDTNGVMKVLPPKTAEESLARERERKARTTLLLALPEDHLAKFHKMTDAKEMWEAIKSRFGGVSTEDANQKFLRALPSSWSQVSLVMRTRQGVDILSFDDLYNNLRVFESDIKGSTASSSSLQNVTFVFSESTISTNDVSTAYVSSTTTGNNSQKKTPSSCSLHANQSSCPQLDHEDLE